MQNPIIRGCTFQNNTATQFGAGITFGNTNGLIEECIFQNNNVPQSIGGGVFIFQNQFGIIAEPTIEIRQSEFLNNNTLAGSGVCFNNFFPKSQILIDSCHFSQNISPPNTQGAAGGVLVQNLQSTGETPSLSVSITNSTFNENSADEGGGIFIFSQIDTTNLSIINNEFTSNTACLLYTSPSPRDS